ncbi:glycoside hydrolase family 78 protein [Fomitiporia mediterranea MF3/22]|uniref:glycoside hydrolase family 78 protein n=1 Tax=Fomitiporia mediterranea (strain MF3/22) TaxID=694068 RepID=UPI0004407CC1|nr:glycoside hydrolase family 78 protein [Fomitiporia mediterranea MF3/22]EJD02571.1 glycoside hydrolase family 78 protein [Fomitiporia mediterranea MF3/22]
MLLTKKYWVFLPFHACLALASAPSGPWDAFNFAPESRLVRPTAIFKTEGTIQNSSALLTEADGAMISGNNSWVTLDFGKEIGGLISLNVDSHTSENSSLSLSFTESPLFISPTTSDDSVRSVASENYDGVLPLPAPLPSGHWTIPKERLRGGFRFLTIVSNDASDVTISNVSCAITFAPHVENLRDYAGYFYAKDPVFHDEDFLTKVWYAGAYTVQTNVLAADEGRQPDVPSPGWANNATIGIASPVFVDGAKRDRDIWPGDMGIAVPASFVSTGDLLPTKNSLATLYAYQDPATGGLPYCGPPLCAVGGDVNVASDTYHAWALIGMYNYFLYTEDLPFLQNLWTNYTKGVQFLENKVQPSGLINISDTADWSLVTRGGEDSEGNALYYKVLTNSAQLATYLNETELASGWSANASALKGTFNDAFWSDELGMYTDNATTNFVPQDGNSLAVLFNLTNTPEQADSISRGLTINWNDIGAVSPESPDTISPFIGGFELQAHFISGNGERALDLLRREWGYMLYTNISVQSTLLEGYTTNGSLGYRAALGYNYDYSYTSHAHGWSTGPTSALTFFVLGLQVTEPQGSSWTLVPHFSGLSAAQGGFATALGWFGASWEINGQKITISVSTPSGTKGIINIPVDGKTADVSASSVIVDGGNHTVIASMN